MRHNLKIIVVVVIAVIIGTLIYWQKSKQVLLNTNTPVLSENAIAGCYVAHLAKDVYILTILSEQGKSIEGTLDIKNFEKDSSVGTLKGTYISGILLADYTFQSEGVWSVGQVVFKKIGDDFVRGYGKPDDATGTRFVDLNKITYDTSVVYKKVSPQECPVLPQ